ncbi:MAG: penicillin-insensitive murein endopeptidase [Cyanobacteriota bacterium]
MDINEELETVDNNTPIELEEEEFECEAPPDPEEILEDTDATEERVPPFPAVNVQLPESGQSYYSYSANRKKQFGLAKTIEAIQAIGKAWHKKHPSGPLIGVGNISLEGGGFMSPHKSHQTGLDVDFRLLRKDGARVGVTFQNPAYSRKRTQELVNVIRANGVLQVKLILFNDPSVKGVEPSSGHDNHLHVRFTL